MSSYLIGHTVTLETQQDAVLIAAFVQQDRALQLPKDYSRFKGQTCGLVKYGSGRREHGPTDSFFTDTLSQHPLQQLCNA